MFWCGFMIGAITLYIVLSILFVVRLMMHNMSEKEHDSIMKIIRKANGKRPVVVEVWEDRDDNSGNAELIGQVILERN